MAEASYSFAKPSAQREDSQLFEEISLLGIAGYMHCLGTQDLVTVVFSAPISGAQLNQVATAVSTHTVDITGPSKRARKQAISFLDKDWMFSVVRALARITLQAINTDRAYMAQLRSELVALGRNPPAAPNQPTFAQLVNAIKSEITNGNSDPTP